MKEKLLYLFTVLLTILCINYVGWEDFKTPLIQAWNDGIWAVILIVMPICISVLLIINYMITGGITNESKN